uniref:Uncharacterized protein n=1 Tax=Anguilla anguilla TaxID=7936 RepID=A0A0E9S0N5_ANGAN
MSTSHVLANERTQTFGK